MIRCWDLVRTFLNLSPLHKTWSHPRNGYLQSTSCWVFAGYKEKNSQFTVAKPVIMWATWVRYKWWRSHSKMSVSAPCRNSFPSQQERQRDQRSLLIPSLSSGARGWLLSLSSRFENCISWEIPNETFTFLRYQEWWVSLGLSTREASPKKDTDN